MAKSKKESKGKSWDFGFFEDLKKQRIEESRSAVEKSDRKWNQYGFSEALDRQRDREKQQSIRQAAIAQYQKNSAMAGGTSTQRNPYGAASASNPGTGPLKPLSSVQDNYDYWSKAYDDYVGSDAFKKGRKYVIDEETGTGRWLEDEQEKQLKGTRDWWKSQLNDEKTQNLMKEDRARIEALPQEAQALLDRVARGVDSDVWDPSSQVAEVSDAKARLRREYGLDKKTMKELTETRRRELNDENMAQMKAEERTASQGVGGAVAQSFASVGDNLVGGSAALIGSIGERLTGTGRYPTLDPNNPAYTAQTRAATARGAVAEQIAGDGGSKGREIAAQVYQAGMNGADNLARMVLGMGSGTKWLSLGLAGINSYGSSVQELSEKGIGSNRAMLMAAVDGGLEIATEYLPMEALLDDIKIAQKASGVSVWDATRRIIGALAKEEANEIPQEVLGLLGSVAAQQLILQESSDYRKIINEKLANGATYEEAKKAANADILQQVKETVVDTAMSTVFSAGGGQLIGAGLREGELNRTGALYQNAAQDLVTESMELDPNNKLAQTAQAKLDSGKKIRNRDLALLAQGNDAVIADQEGAQYQDSKQDLVADTLAADPENELAAQIRDQLKNGGKVENVDLYRLAQAKVAAEERRNLKANAEIYQEQRQQNAAQTLAQQKGGEVSQNIRDGLEGLKLSSVSRPVLENGYWAHKDKMSEAEYALGIREAYRFGQNGMYEDLEKGEFSGKLHRVIRLAAYNAGYRAGGKQVTLDTAKVNRQVSTAPRGSGVIHYEGKVNVETDLQKTSVKVLEKVGEIMGRDFYLYESTEEQRKNGAPNGYYDPSDNSIHIDVKAGMDGRGTILFTASHELTHDMRQNAPAQYKKLQNFLFKAYGQEGQSVDRLVKAKMDTMQNQKNFQNMAYEQQYEAALEEVVCDSMETMLTDENVYEKLEQLRKTDRTTWQKIKDFISNLASKIQAVYKDLEPDSDEGKAVAQMKDSLDQLQQLFAEGLDASARNQEAARARADGQKNSASNVGGVKMQIRYTKDNRPVVEIQENILDGVPKKNWVDTVKHAMSQFGGSIPISGKLIKVNRVSKSEFTNSKYTQYIRANDGTIYADKMRSAGNLDEIVLATTNYVNEDLKHRRKDNFTEFSRGNVNLRIGGNGYTAEVVVGFTSGRQMILYDIVDFTPTTFDIKNKTSPAAMPEAGSHRSGMSSMESIAQTTTKSQDRKFMARKAVEETKDLLAIHNLTERNLTDALNLGGLPSPSIAIVKAKAGHTMYGPISFLFAKNTIDPESDIRNKVYGSDAYTPTAPSIEYEIKDKAASRLRDKYYDLYRTYGAELSRPLYGFGNYAEDELNKYHGVDGVIDHFSDNTDMMRLYLADTKGETVADVQKEEVTRIPESYRTMYDFLIENTGKDIWVENMPSGAPMPFSKWIIAHESDFKNAYAEYCRSEGMTTEEINAFYEDDAEFRDTARSVWRGVRDYVKNGPEKRSVELDIGATKKAIREAVDQESYMEWLHGLFDGIEKRKGIYNGKDRYTASGNNRSFSALHYEYTLDNIVRAMVEGQAERGGQTWGLTAGTLQATATPEYSSIAEIKNDSKRLGRVSDEELSAAKEALSAKIDGVIEDIFNSTKHWDDNRFSEMEHIGDAVKDAALGRRTTTAIMNSMKKSGWPINAEMAERIIGLYKDAAAMPTEYFEAKPQRAIGFEEVLAAVMPDNASPSLVSRLAQQGVPVVTYEAGNENDRLAKLNGIDGAKFQERKQRSDAEIRAMERENKKLRQDLEDTKALLSLQKQVTGGTVITKTSEQTMARNLMRTYNARGNALELAPMMDQVYSYIAKGEDVTWEGIQEKAQGAVDYVMEHLKQEQDGYAADVLSQMKGTHIALDAQQLQEASSAFDGMRNFRRALNGSGVTVDSNGMSLDSWWQEMAVQYPDMFDSEISASDMPAALADTVDRLRNMKTDATTGYGEEAVRRDILQDIYDGYWKVSTLHTVADKYQKQVNELKGRHADAMAEIKSIGQELELERAYRKKDMKAIDKVLKEAQGGNIRKAGQIAGLQWDLNKANERIRQMAQEKKDALKAAEDQRRFGLKSQQAQLMQKARDQRARATEKRNRTKIKNDIKGILSGLDKRMNHPTEGKYIPANMRKTVAGVLASIDRVSGRKGAAAENLATLAAQYAQLKEDKSGGSYAFDESIAQALQEVGSYGVPLEDMTMEQLQNTKNALKAMDHVIKESTKLHGLKLNGIDPEISIFDFSKGMIRETRTIDKRMDGKIWKYMLTQSRPELAFKLFGGYSKNSNWMAAYNALNNAQRYGMDIQRSLGSLFNDVVTDPQAGTLFDTKHLVDVGLKDENGRAVPITRGMMLSLYMHLQNEENAKHVMQGGITVPDMKGYYKGDTDNAYKIGIQVVGTAQGLAVIQDQIDNIQKQIQGATEQGKDTTDLENRYDQLQQQAQDLRDSGDAYIGSLLNQISEQLTAYDRKVIASTQILYKATQPYLNSATNTMYGFDKATVENYFPIITDKSFLGTHFDSISANFNLENAGFMKDRKKGANPILLSDIIDTNQKQIKRTAQYASMAPVLRDFNRVISGQLPGYQDSVAKALGNKFGSSGDLYIEHLMADLNGGGMNYKDMTGLDVLLRKVRGNMAGATLSVNPRVALSQTASFPTAAAELGWGPLGKAISKNAFTKTDEALIAKYSPLLWYRMQGNSTIELGDMRKSTTTMGKLDRATRWATGWIGGMDAWTVKRLWFASEYWVQDNQKDLQKGSDAYYQAVAEKFNQVVERTQPNYSTMQRSDLLRSKNEVVKMLTMFTTQRSQNFNILYDAALDSYFTKRRAAAGLASTADLKVANQKLASAVSSQVAAAGTYVAIRLLVDALLHRMDPYRDEDEELTWGTITDWGSIPKELRHQFTSTLVGTLAGGSELYDMIYAVVNKQKYWGLSLSGVSSLDDAAESMVKLFQSKDAATFQKNLRSTALKLAIPLGLPVNNVVKIFQGIYGHIQDFQNGELGRFESGVDRSNKQYADLFLKSMDDPQKAQKILGKWGSEAEEKNIKSAVKTAVKDGILAGTVDEEKAKNALDRFYDSDETEKNVRTWAWIRDNQDLWDDFEDLTDGMTKRDEILPVIDSMNISKEQKDALYRAKGYAESTIEKAPWH